MSISKRQLLTNIFNEFELELSKVSESSILPGNSDIEDVLFYFDMYFGNVKPENVLEKLNELYEMQDIELGEIEKSEFMAICQIFVLKVKNILNTL
jgi:hypothetical protein